MSVLAAPVIAAVLLLTALPQAGTPPRFRLSVSVPPASRADGPAVPIVVRARYEGDRPGRILLPRWPFSVVVADRRGRPVWVWRGVGSGGARGAVRLAAGSVIGFAASWRPDPGLEPGRYRVVVFFHPTGQRAEAQVVILNREPSLFALPVPVPADVRWPLVALCAVVGAVLASFAGVLGWRVPRGMSVVWPPSFCDACGAGIPPRDNVPVVSWLLLRGRCRACGARVHPVYPVVEAVLAAVFAAAAWRFGPSWGLAAMAVFGLFLAACTVSDVHHGVIPDVFTLPAIAAGLVLSWLAGSWEAMVRAALSVLGMGAVFLAAAVASGGGMGGGDVKMAAAVGAFLGLRPSAVALFLCLLAGGVYAAVMLLTRRMTRGSAFPFGPFIAFGAVLSALFWPELYLWYLGRW